MPNFYRVHPLWPDAEPGAKGHPLFVQRGGTGRVDNSEYATLYVADSPSCAIAEAFGTFGTWDSSLFEPRPGWPPGAEFVVTTYRGSPTVVDLDDVGELTTLGIRPSRVVTRNRSHTQAWALAIHSSDRAHGVRWWSYYEPDWGSLGLWDVSELEVLESAVLSVRHPAVVQAASVMSRPLLRD